MPFRTRYARLIPVACRAALAAFVATAAPLSMTGGAAALSEIPEEEVAPPPADAPIEKLPLPPVGEVPAPDPIRPPADTTVEPPPVEAAPPPDESAPPADEAVKPVDPNAPLPEVVYDLSRLPEPVRRMHGLIVEAARSGDLEKLRPLVGVGEEATHLSVGDTVDDPIEFLRQSSGDMEGQEILAILEEVLDAGYVHLDPGTSEELYVWPYFFGIPLEKLDARQRVELFKIVTAGDYEEMLSYGAYNFYRTGITPDGRWAFFVAGD